MKFKLIFLLLIIFSAVSIYAEARIGVSGTVEWDALRINSLVSLDLASAGIKLPAGRTQGEALLSEGYFRLMRPCLLGLQVDSSSTIGSLVDRGEITLLDVESIVLGASSVPPALSPDIRSISAQYSIAVSSISSALLRHSRQTPVMRVLNPPSAAQYTGIIIIAEEALPVHGMKSTALPVPCLFPKIWDSGMNLIYERSMLETGITLMARYSTSEHIYRRSPSGLSPELQSIIGERPLRIFAKGVYGINPTDLIIDKEDALQIISTEQNRRLLSEGKVVIILDKSVLKHEFKE